MMRRLLTLASVLCLVAATAPAGAATQRRGARQTARRDQRKANTASASPAKTAAAAAPVPVVTEIDLEGLKKLLQRNAGGAEAAKARPLLVNFWATWCDPCREEFPDLVKLNNDYKDRGLDFVVISGDEVSEIKAGVPKFLGEMKATMPAYLLNVPDMEVAINSVDTTWGGDMPATFLFDREGKIIFKHLGRVDPKELRAALDKILAN